MKLKKRSATAWAISVVFHVMLFLIVFPPAGGGSKGGLEIVGVDVLDMNGAAAQNASLKASAREPHAETAFQADRNLPQEPVPDKPPVPAQSSAPAAPKTVGPKTLATPSTAPTGAGKGNGEGTGTGDGHGASYGAGDGYVLERPVYYPKNAQNDGSGGRVQLAIILGTSGAVRAEIIQSSGDDRLDRYSLRAVVEAWKYRAPPTTLRIRVFIVFENGSVQVSFEGAEPVKEEASQP